MIDLDFLPCSNDITASCAKCELHNNGCPVEIPYNVVKVVIPVKTTPKAGVDVRELVKTKFPQQFKNLFLDNFDWGDLDGVLDYLYGERDLGLIGLLTGISKTDITKIIKLIENNCEVHNG